VSVRARRKPSSNPQRNRPGIRCNARANPPDRSEDGEEAQHPNRRAKLLEFFGEEPQAESADAADQIQKKGR
jgi:hypothetical protein